MVSFIIFFFKTLKTAAQLDIFDLNYAYSSEKMQRISFLPPHQLPEQGYINAILRYLWHLLKAIGAFNWGHKLEKNKIVFFVISKSENDSMKPVAHETENATTLNESGKVKRIFPLHFAYLISILYIPFLLIKYARANTHQKKSFRYILDQYLLTYGYFITSCLLLRDSNSKSVVVSNDHMMKHRTIIYAAKHLGLPTFYMQHASVTNKFPPLIYDYALLDGVDALIKYDNTKTNTNVYLIGMPKLDRYINKSKTNIPKKYSFGICTNALDPIEEVEKIILYLQKKANQKNIILRPHPGDSRRTQSWNLLAKKLNIAHSNSLKESAFDFLFTVDNIIAGDSSILLEAALVNVCPIYYDIQNLNLDYYGFKKTGLVLYANNINALETALINKSTHRAHLKFKSKYYCDTISTEFEGNSAKLAARIIKHFSSNKKSALKQWGRCQGYNLSTYSLKN